MPLSVSLDTPYLSEFDPSTEAEGGVDPLSLQRTYERLAERVYPFVTVRMSRPRFVTAMAAGAHVCRDILEEVAADEVTPAWLVFEWHVVEALVRCSDQISDDQRWGIPGISKVGSAIGQNRRVSAATYLKTPKIFGFTGIYRRLAYGLQLLDDQLRLDEGGFELVRAWEEDQGMGGFLAGNDGKGAQFREGLRRAVEGAMGKGHTSQASRWPLWETITRAFRPDAAGLKEAAVIATRLSRADLRQHPEDPQAAEMRREMITHLEARGQAVSRPDEPSFFQDLGARASDALRKRLEAIAAYEALCRLLDDSFRLILHMSTQRGAAPVDAGDFAAHELAKHHAASLEPAINRLEEAFAGSLWEDAVVGLVRRRYSAVRDAPSLFWAVLEHHEKAQASKPPDGKRPWVERVPGAVVRPAYRRPDPPAEGDHFVHDYRTDTVSGFLQDLRRLPR